MNKLRLPIYKALKRTEGFFKTDMIYAAKGSFWMTFGQVVSSVLSLLVIIAFANLLPKETYGLYKYILSLVGILGIFTLTGMNSAVTQAVASGDDGALVTSVKYQLKWNLLMVLGFFVLGGYYLLNGDQNMGISLFILGIFVPTTLALNTYGSYLEGKKNFKVSNISSTLSTIVYIVGMLLVIYFSGEVILLVVVYALSTFFTTLFFYIYVLKKFKPGENSDTEALKYGKELTFIGFIAPIAAQVDKITLAHFWGATALASYSLALAVPDRAAIFLKNYVGLGFPKFSTKTPLELNTVFWKRIVQGLSVGILAAIVYIFLAPFLFKYLLPQYLDSLFFSQILALGMVFAIPNRYLSLLLVSQKMSKTIFINNLIQNLLKIALYAVMGFMSGVFGLVLAYVINSFVSLLINISFWRTATSTA
jgi:O-antigen/teichoic acid export membrane protein